MKIAYEAFYNKLLDDKNFIEDIVNDRAKGNKVMVQKNERITVFYWIVK